MVGHRGASGYCRKKTKTIDGTALTAWFTEDFTTEYAAFFRAGIVGLFSDNPDTAVAARDPSNRAR